MNDYLPLAAGVVCGGLGGELFVRGVVGLASWARVSPGIIAATFAAFATSSPELTVAVNSALAGIPEISLGDALGSNIVNVALILAVAALIAPLGAPRDTLRRDLPAAILAPILLGVLALDSSLSQADGIVLLAAFAIWLAIALVEARRQRSAAPAVVGERRHGFALLSGAAGLMLLVAAGRFIVLGAQGIADRLNVDTFIVGATLVALGTSVPELATAIMSQIRRHGEIGLGTILGSNVFNTLFIIGVAATLAPIRVVWNEVSLALLFGIAAVAVIVPDRIGLIGRVRGVVLLALYALYVVLAVAP